jgi:hypothetical protein
VRSVRLRRQANALLELRGKPDLPQSVFIARSGRLCRQGLRLTAFRLMDHPPAGRAEYAGPGSAEVWICVYKASTSAFDAVQRARAEAQTVKFQQGANLVLVKWNTVPKASVTALVRAIQKAVPTQ